MFHRHDNLIFWLTEQLTRNQNAAQHALAPILKELHMRTGYVGALILAAPDGARGGEMSTMRCVTNRLLHVTKFNKYQYVYREDRPPPRLGAILH